MYYVLKIPVPSFCKHCTRCSRNVHISSKIWEKFNTVVSWVSQEAVKFLAVTVTCAVELSTCSSAKPEGKNHLGDTGVDGKILLKCILNKQGRGWLIFLVQNRDTWRDYVDKAMDFHFSKKARNFLGCAKNFSSSTGAMFQWNFFF